MIFLVKLFLAHFLGDFLLQPKSWVNAKDNNKLKAPQLYFHVLIHGGLSMLFLWDLALWLPVLLVTLSHFVIDSAKLIFQNSETKRRWFLLDQGLHIAVILVVAWVMNGTPSIFENVFPETTLIYITAFVLVTMPASVMIGMVISKWTPHTEEKPDDSLEDAGKYIGIFERLFVLGFAISGHWEAIGFLIAAKSVFRFGDLKESKDRKLTEYILIGTLLSFGFALLVGFLVLHIMTGQESGRS